MPKLLRRWWTKTYELEPQVKIKNSFMVAQHEGLITDEVDLCVNDTPLVSFEAGLRQFHCVFSFELYDKPYEFRFNYNIWTGQPRSLIVLQEGRILAQYGDDTALKVTNKVAST